MIVKEKEKAFEQAKLFAAKSNENRLWECVPQHLADTAGVARRFTDPDTGWVSPAFINASGLETDVFIKISVFIAAVHDIGKLTPVFQHRISRSLEGLSGRLLDQGYDISAGDTDDPYHHSFLSGAILHEYFGTDESICEVIAAHHGKPRGNGPRFDWRQPFKRHRERTVGRNEEFPEIWEGIVGWAEEISGIRRAELPSLEISGQILLAHVLMMSDWIASNEEYFPLTSVWDTSPLNDPLRVTKGYEMSGVRRGWCPQTFIYDSSLFADRFGFTPNKMQETACRAAQNGAQLMIIEAPMGTGKTEAALMCTEIMSSIHGSGGLYIGLPTQATSNSLFPRMLSWASDASLGLPVTVNLVHGAAAFNEEYRSILFNTNEPDHDNMSVNRWMNGKHRKMMADFVDGTIDQAVSMALDKKYFMLLHGQLAGKAVVFDEIHSYDAYTDGYIETSLAYLGLYHCPVVLLSATLTDEKKADLIRAYAQDRKKQLPVPSTGSSCCVTWYDGGKVTADTVPENEDSRREYRLGWAESSDLPGMIREAISDGGCAGVIRNTTAEAYFTYRALKDALPDCRVILLHSHFLAEHRAGIEKEILKRVGKNSTAKDRDRLVIVGTQVFEQSLDIDVDILFTDICPMDLFLQRLGRQHRHKRVRPGRLTSPHVFILLKNGKPVGGGGRPYNDFIIDRTMEILKAKKTLTLPADIKPLVEETYDLSLSKDSKKKKEYEEKIKSLRRNSKNARIPEPWDAESLQGWCERGAVADVMGVRAANDTYRVIMLKKCGGCITDIEETVSCRIGDLPDEAVERTFLKQIIHLPSYRISCDELERMRANTGFGTEAPWKYKDILLLDEDNSYTHLNNGREEKYIYSKETGLTRKEEQ